MDAITSQIIQLAAELIQQLGSSFERAANDGSRILPPSSGNHHGTEEELEFLDRRLGILSQAQEFAIGAIKLYVQSTTSKIKLRRNQLVPVYRLPPEIYSQIFEIVSQEYSKSWRGDVGAPWRVSQVSSLWRDIALSTPMLWTVIDRDDPEFIKSRILRSRNSLLKIALWDHTPALTEDGWEPDPAKFEVPCTAHEQIFKDSMSILLPHVHRWGSMTLGGVRTSNFWPQFHLPAPRLKELELSLGADDPNEDLPTSSHDLFAGSTPSLRHVRLERIYIPITSSIYAGLIYLELESIDFRNFTADMLLDRLKESPFLETLTLRWILLSDPWPQSEFTVEFPRLRSFDIEDTTSSAIRHLLAFVYAPSLHDLSVCTDLAAEEPLVNALPLDMVPNLQRTMENFSGISRLKIVFMPAPHLNSLKMEGFFDRGPDLALQYQSPTPRSLLNNFFPRLAPIFQFQGLKTFCVIGITDDLSSASEFAEFLATLPDISRLEFNRCSCSFFLVLRADAQRHLCPKLSELWIKASPVDDEALMDMVRSRNEIMIEDEEWTGLRSLHIAGPEPLAKQTISTLNGLVREFTFEVAHPPEDPLYLSD